MTAPGDMVERLNDAASIIEQWDAWEIGAANKPSRRLTSSPSKYLREAAARIRELEAALNNAHQLAAKARDSRTTAHVIAPDDIQDIVEATRPIARSSLNQDGGKI